MSRLLTIWLDGYEDTIAVEMMDSGQLPALASLREKSARFLLDHGSAKRTGLAAEHFSSGLSPEDAGRWSAFGFDRNSYDIRQEGARCAPFTSKMKSRTVVFDMPYFDFSLASNAQGLTAWGAHDPGSDLASNPAGLVDEVLERFGPYPAQQWVYGFAWPSPERCRTMGEQLVRGIEQRSKVALWLLKERLPDWDLGLVGVSESHSCLEGLWHGIDDRHPLHHLPSSSAAGEGIRNVYRAIDRLIGDLLAEFEDATVVVASMHGMGPNQSDVSSMVLLPELLFREAFGEPFLRERECWTKAPDGLPILAEDERWQVETPGFEAKGKRLRGRVSALVPKPVKTLLKQALPLEISNSKWLRPLQWMPAARYQPYWHQMRAFALPSYFDGRIRINLAGREREGLVPFDDYEACCDGIQKTLEACVDPATGDGVVDFIEFHCDGDPWDLDSSHADMTVVWKGAPLSFEHPTIGKIGPIPYFRIGGHTGDFGMAYLKGEGIAPGDRGVRSSFDIVPTLFDLRNEQKPNRISGQSLLMS